MAEKNIIEIRYEVLSLGNSLLTLTYLTVNGRPMVSLAKSDEHGLKRFMVPADKVAELQRALEKLTNPSIAEHGLDKEIRRGAGFEVLE